jgi:hypothetical protein
MNIEFDLNSEVKKLMIKKNIEEKKKIEEQLIEEEFRIKCEAIDAKIKELNTLKKGQIRRERKEALLAVQEKYQKLLD